MGPPLPRTPRMLPPLHPCGTHRRHSSYPVRTCPTPAAAIRQSMRDRVRLGSARAPRASSLLKPTISRAISTASRSLDAPSAAFASRSRGSSQNALRTFPARVARAPEIATRGRDDRVRLDERRRRVDAGTDPPVRTPEHTMSYVRMCGATGQTFSRCPLIGSSNPDGKYQESGCVILRRWLLGLGAP